MTGLPQTFHNVVAFIWFFFSLKVSSQMLDCNKFKEI